MTLIVTLNNLNNMNDMESDMFDSNATTSESSSFSSSNSGNKLPKFNHLYPILFFANFIQFCGANKCGAPLASKDGTIDGIVTLEDSGAQQIAEADTPTRAQVAAEAMGNVQTVNDGAQGQPTPSNRSTRNRRGGNRTPRTDRTPRPADITYEQYQEQCHQVRDNSKKAERYVEECRRVAGYLTQAVAGDPVGEGIVDSVLGFNGIDGPKAFKTLWEQNGPHKMRKLLLAKFLKFKQSPKLPVALFIARLNQYFKYLQAAGKRYTDEEKLDELLTRIAPEFLMFAQQLIESSQATWIDVCSKLIQTAEVLRLREVIDGPSVEPGEPSAMRAVDTRAAGSDMKCHHCKRKGHIAEECINAPGLTPDQKNERFEKFKAAKMARGEWKTLNRNARARCGMVDPDDEDALAEFYSSTGMTARSAQGSAQALDQAAARSAHADLPEPNRTDHGPDETGSVVGSEEEFEARAAIAPIDLNTENHVQSSNNCVPAAPTNSLRNMLHRVAYICATIAIVAGAMALPGANAVHSSRTLSCHNHAEHNAAFRPNQTKVPVVPPLPPWASEYAAPHGIVAVKTAGMRSACARRSARDRDHLVYDGGATHHFLRTTDYFTNDYRRFDDDKLSVKVASGARVKMVGCGTAVVPVVDDRGEEVQMRLVNAVYVPDFAQSLISMPQLYDAGCQSNFDPKAGAKLVANHESTVFDRQHTVVPIVYRDKTFYFPAAGDTKVRSSPPPKARFVAGQRRQSTPRVCPQVAPRNAWFAEHAFDATDAVDQHDAGFEHASAMRASVAEPVPPRPTSPRSVFRFVTETFGVTQAANAIARARSAVPITKTATARNSQCVTEPSIDPNGVASSNPTAVERMLRSRHGGSRSTSHELPSPALEVTTPPPESTPCATEVNTSSPESATCATNSSKEVHSQRTCSTTEQAQYLHELFVHARYEDVKGTLSKGSATAGIDGIPRKLSCSCRGCLLAKATRAPRSKRKRTPTSRPFEILDVDYFEVNDPSFSGCRTAMTITCRHTRFRWSFLLRSKELGPGVFSNFMKERRAEGIVAGSVTLQGDNAMLTKRFRQACRSVRVKPQACAPYAHWQNGIAERGFRTLLESTKAVLFAKRLPTSFWGLAFLHCTHVLNGVGRARAGHVSPHEALFGKPFNAEHLLPFGTIVIAHKENATKLAPKGRPGIYVGESVHHAKGTVKIFMPDTKRVVHSNAFRVVQFATDDNAPTLRKWRTLINGHDNQWPIVAQTSPASAPPWAPSSGTLPLFLNRGELESAPPTSSDLGGNEAVVERMIHEIAPSNATVSPHTDTERAGVRVSNDRLIQQTLMDKYGSVDVPFGDGEVGHVVAAELEDGERMLVVEHESGRDRFTVSEVDAAIATAAQPTQATEWIAVPRDGMSTRDIANDLFQVDPDTYASFINEYTFQFPGQAAVHPNINTKFDVGTEVPVPHGHPSFAAHRSVAEDSDDPTVSEALDPNNPDRAEWKQSLQSHWDGLLDYGTFEFKDMSELTSEEQRHLVGSRWVCHQKRDGDGRKTIKKSRLVGKGYTQREGIDFSGDRCTSSVCRIASVRTILAIAALEGIEPEYRDISHAYLNASMDFVMHIRLPEGFEQTGKDGLPRVARVRKALFGFKQSGRLWADLFDQTLLEDLGFERLKSDPCVYVQRGNGPPLYLAIYCDDLLIVCSDQNKVEKFDKELGKHFALRNEGRGNGSMLGMKITVSGQGSNDFAIKLNMPGYIRQLLKRTKMDGCNPVKSPAESKFKLSRKDPLAEDGGLINGVPYRSCCGAVLWAALTCRPELSHTVMQLCRFVNAPTTKAVSAMKRLLRHISQDVERGITYRSNGEREICAYSDADWGDCTDTARSTTGFVVMLAGAAIDWRSKLQPTVALSTVEAEAMALCAATVEVEYTRGLLGELFGDKYIAKATPIYVDNKGARDDAYNKTGKRTRHINMRFHRVREAVTKDSIVVQRVTGGNDPATSEMVADILTKSTPAPLFIAMMKIMSGIRK